ncbi:MAG: hypothetical protein ACFFBE_09745 [Promethearchaeota archaeon]
MGKLRIFSSPYGVWETIIWVVKHIVIDIIYPLVFLCFLFVIIDEIPFNTLLAITIICGIFILIFTVRAIQRRLNRINNIGKLNEDGWREKKFEKIQTSLYKIGFVGDIMKMGDYWLRFDKRVIKFFKDVDLIVGNLEGIITTSKWLGLSAQKHDISILSQLKYLGHPPKNWLLCTSNNHSSDFGSCEFENSNKKIKRKNFRLFGGISENQYYLYPNNEINDHKEKKEEINFVSGTMWNNQRDHDSVGQFEDINNHYKDDKFNILFPHWHFENECYVRRRNQYKSITLLLTGYYLLFDQLKKRIYRIINENILNTIQNNVVYRKIRRYFCKLDWVLNRNYYQKFKENNFQNWDIIYGHHSHVPQSITNYGSRLLAFSGGNLTSSKTRKKHISGLIVKCEIGRVLNKKPLTLGNVEWSYSINEKEKIKLKKNALLKGIKEIKVNTVIIDDKRNRTNSFTNWRNKLWTNIFYIICAFVLEFILLCSIFGLDPNFGIEIPLEFLQFFRDHQIITNVIVVAVFISLIFLYIYRSHRT